MKTFSDVVQSNIDEDVRELKAYRDGYVMHAGLSHDAGYDGIADAYLSAVLHLEIGIQALETIPSMTRRV